MEKLVELIVWLQAHTLFRSGRWLPEPFHQVMHLPYSFFFSQANHQHSGKNTIKELPYRQSGPLHTTRTFQFRLLGNA